MCNRIRLLRADKKRNAFEQEALDRLNASDVSVADVARFLYCAHGNNEALADQVVALDDAVGVLKRDLNGVQESMWTKQVLDERIKLIFGEQSATIRREIGTGKKTFMEGLKEFTGQGVIQKLTVFFVALTLFGIAAFACGCIGLNLPSIIHTVATLKSGGGYVE